MNPPNTKMIPWFVLFVLALGIFTAAQPGEAVNLNAHWEYTYLSKIDSIARYNQLGHDGWEMSGVCDSWVYFKRKI